MSKRVARYKSTNFSTIILVRCLHIELLLLYFSRVLLGRQIIDSIAYELKVELIS